MATYQDRPWLALYQNGVAANIDVNEYETVNEFLQKSLDKYANRIAFTSFGRDMKCKELDKKSSLFGAYLVSRGLKAGDRMALMMPNILQYPIALLGCFKAGIIVVNTNPLYTPREMEYQFKDSGVKAILIVDNFASNLETIIGNTDIDIVITTSIGELAGMAKGRMINFTLKYIKRSRPSFSITNAVTFSEALKLGKSFNIPEFENTRDTVIMHQYTGGTTGVSKGAMLTNGNLVANMLQIREILNPILGDTTESKNVLAPLPMYHIFSFTVNILGMLGLGHRNILIANPRDLGSIIKEFNNYSIHLITGVNTLFNALLNDKNFTELDFSPLRITVGGGAAIQPVVAEKWKEVTGCNLVEGYGLTETSPVATLNPCDGRHRLGSIGLPVPSTLMRIVNTDGNEVPIGEKGEIQIKGPQVMKGYYNKEEDTQNALTDGWLNTGDIGLMEEDGFFKIVDRQKDMINVSGFNVYPNEIESVLSNHPKILESAAIGIPNEISGECVKIYVVKKDKSLKEKELIQYCRENMAAYKVPKEIVFLKELPKSNVGKILRRELRGEVKK